MGVKVRPYWFARKVQWTGWRPNQLDQARVARIASASAATPGRIEGSAICP
jgi:hypothetical protein